MRILTFKYVAIFLAIASMLFVLSSRAEDSQSNPFGGDPFGGLGDSLPPVQMETAPAATELPSSSTSTSPTNNTSHSNGQSAGGSSTPENSPSSGTTNQQQPALNQIESSDLQSPVQNAVIEGIQITTDKGATPEEKVVSGYFIFRDKPSSYFYEVKLREKKLVFEFNDTKTGSSPVPSASEAPIKGFTIVSDKVDINKDVKGLKPEYHDLIKVIFDLDAVPDIHVNDEYSIITFSFKWNSNPLLQSKYVVKDKTPKVVLWSTVGVGAVAGVVVAAVLVSRPKPQTEGPVPIDDLPLHPTP